MKPTYEEFRSLVKANLMADMPELSESEMEEYLNTEDAVGVIKREYEISEDWLNEGKITEKMFRNGSVSATAYCLYMMY